MTEPIYLIAHRVRGEPAFDVAIKQPCVLCQVYENVNGEMVGPADYEQEDCVECEQLGYWWIIPTSGHRAFPYWYTNLETIIDGDQLKLIPSKISLPGGPPKDLRDHYEVNKEPAKPACDRTPSLAHTLGLIKPINRRI